MNNQFGHIPEEVLDFVTSQDEIIKRRAERKARRKKERGEALKKRAELRAKREAARSSRQKKTWGNFLS